MSIAENLGLNPMVSHNTDNHETAFTVSIDYKNTTTGISAFERANTIKELINEESKVDYNPIDKLAGIYNDIIDKELITNLYEYNQKQIISEKTAETVKNMLKTVVEEGAMGRACPEHLSAGGKTGTAQTGRYNDNGTEILIVRPVIAEIALM